MFRKKKMLWIGAVVRIQKVWRKKLKIIRDRVSVNFEEA